MTWFVPIGADDLVVASERSGSWNGVGAWLASALNGLDAAVRRGDVDRAERRHLLQEHVLVARGEHHDIDVIVLPDGTRVCWHPDRRPKQTRWIVERRGERCLFGRHV